MVHPGADRRLRARYRVRVPFTLKNDGQEIQGITRNISLLGISAYSSSSITQVQPVRCLLAVPHRPQPLVAHGTVIRCEPLAQPLPDGTHEIGVFFKEFEGTDEAELSKFLYQLLEEERSAIRAGYRALKQRLAARHRRKRLEAKLKRKRKAARLRRKKLRLARLKRSVGKKPRGRPRKRSTASRGGRKSS